MRFKSEIHNIIPQPRNYCEECNDVRICTFEFNKLKTPLKDGATSIEGCIVCDDFLTSITEIVTGRTINLQVQRQIRHKRNAGGRGRGRRGRKPRGDPRMTFSGF